MIGRRSALRAVFAMPAVMSAMTKVAAETENLPSGNALISGAADGDVYSDEQGPFWDALGKAKTQLWQAREERGRQAEHLPPHIAGMKSWSPAFKKSVWVKEEREFREAERILDELQHGSLSLVAKKKLLKSLGIEI